tara:strand:+ start:2220 stop:2465 length:246 start_codon:yes stop_codon:yes gene_type:complete
MTIVDELRKTNGRYKTNKSIHQKIDKILHTNAIMFSNLGCDDSLEMWKKAKRIEWKRLQEIKTMDYAFYKLACPYNRPNDL